MANDDTKDGMPRPMRLAVALVLLQQLRAAGGRPSGSSTYLDGIDARLVGRVTKAQDDLDSFRKGRAFGAALDEILPGWFDIDTELADLPKEAEDFVSNDPKEWVAHLVKHGMDEEDARAFVEDNRP